MRGHKIHMKETRTAYKILVENLKGTDHLGYQDVDGNVPLNGSLRKRIRTGLIWHSVSSKGGFL
jgi:hypothetical protein